RLHGVVGESAWRMDIGAGAAGDLYGGVGRGELALARRICGARRRASGTEDGVVLGSLSHSHFCQSLWLAAACAYLQLSCGSLPNEPDLRVPVAKLSFRAGAVLRNHSGAGGVGASK